MKAKMRRLIKRRLQRKSWALMEPENIRALLLTRLRMSKSMEARDQSYQADHGRRQG